MPQIRGTQNIAQVLFFFFSESMPLGPRKPVLSTKSLLFLLSFKTLFPYFLISIFYYHL